MSVSFLETIPVEILGCIISNLVHDIDAIIAISHASKKCLKRVLNIKIEIPWTTNYVEVMTVADYKIYCKRRYHPAIKALQGLYIWMDMKLNLSSMASGLAIAINALEDVNFMSMLMEPIQEEMEFTKQKWIPLFGSSNTSSRYICSIGLIPMEEFVPDLSKVDPKDIHTTISSKEFLDNFYRHVNETIRVKLCEPALPRIEQMFNVNLYVALWHDQDIDESLPADYVAVGISICHPTYIFRMPHIKNHKKSFIKKAVSRTKRILGKVKRLL